MEAPQNAEAQSAVIDLWQMRVNAELTAQFLRGLANPHRLLILCHLTHGERSVGALERELGMRQAHLSQQLARLRQDGLVKTRRDSRTIYYELRSTEANQVLCLLHALFCGTSAANATAH